MYIYQKSIYDAVKCYTNFIIYCSTETSDKKYSLVLYLFGPVISEKTVHKNTGREIKIYLTKALKCIIPQ